jgi:heptosyltransferase-3
VRDFVGTRSTVPVANVFIFRIGHLGDTLASLPAIHRIAELHPDARLWLITNAPAHASLVTAWDVLAHTGLFHAVLFYDRRNPWQLLRLAARCRVTGAELLYYLSPPRSHAQLRRDRLFFRWACGFKQIAAVPTQTSLVLRDADGQLLIMPREAERLLRSVDSAGIAPEPPYLRPPARAERKAEECLHEAAGRPLVGIGPGSKMPAKKWFLERYIELCKRIRLQRPDIVMVVFGGPEDREAGDAILQAVGAEHILNLAGRTDVIESAAALRHCGMYIGNDTGTMHLAATMGVPCIAIFTSRDNRDTWSPWGDAHVILRRDLPCSGCLLERCERERMRCLDLISVDDVWAEVEPRLRALTVPGAATRVLSSPEC